MKMHCEKITLKSGQIRWACVEDGPPDPVTGKRQQIWRRGKTQREAKDRVKKAINEMENGSVSPSRPVRRKKMTFYAFADEWLATICAYWCKKGHSPHSEEGNKNIKS